MGERYFHPFGPHGQNLSGRQVPPALSPRTKRRALPGIREWSMSGVAAELGRFARPARKRRCRWRRLLTRSTSMRVSMRASSDARRRNGAERVEGKIVDVAVDGESGHIGSVSLADGRSFGGELFIDCSGFRGLLIEEKLGTGYDDWSHWLPCDRAVAVPSGLTGQPDPFTRATARIGGGSGEFRCSTAWAMGLSIRVRISAARMPRALLLANLEADPIAQPRHLAFKAGRRRLAWNANVVSLGLSSGFSSRSNPRASISSRVALRSCSPVPGPKLQSCRTRRI